MRTPVWGVVATALLGCAACAQTPEPIVIGGQQEATPAGAAEARPMSMARVFRDPLASGGLGPEMAEIPAGSFVMGSPGGGLFRLGGVGPQHEVSLAGFAAGRYEVTFDEWEACVAAGGCDGYRPNDDGKGRGTRPARLISWEDAHAYTRWLSAETGETYRLLSSAQWEYAARAGTTTDYPWGDSADQGCAYGNIADQTATSYLRTVVTANCTDGYIHPAPVGSFAANAFGLHDMQGNLWEWVEDCDHRDYSGAPSDGSAWTSDCLVDGRTTRIQRGGSWNSPLLLLESARYIAGEQNAVHGTGRIWDVGFRVARTLSPD